MNRAILYYLFMLSALALVGCGAQGGASSEAVAEEGCDVNYGISTEDYRLSRSEVKAGETMSDIMTSFGRTAHDVNRVDRASKSIFPLTGLRAGERYVAFLAKDQQGREHLDYLVYEKDPLSYVLFVMVGDSISVHLREKPTVVKRRSCVAVVESSVWSALMAQHIPHTIGKELERIYSGSVDFFGVRSGDRFTLIYDEKFVDDSISVGVVAIEAIKFVHRDRAHYAIAYRDGQESDFWDETGASLRKRALRSPLTYSRISSRYSSSKSSPAYKIYRGQSVKYSAPTGTSVHAVADGVVVYRGVDSEDGGDMIKIEHGDGLVTGYSNLRRLVRGVDRGSKLLQGDVIGYVGGADNSADSYLTYEAWVDGEEVNPHSVASQPCRTISRGNKKEYAKLARAMVAEMDSVERSVVKSKL